MFQDLHYTLKKFLPAPANLVVAEAGMMVWWGLLLLVDVLRRRIVRVLIAIRQILEPYSARTAVGLRIALALTPGLDCGAEFGAERVAITEEGLAHGRVYTSRAARRVVVAVVGENHGGRVVKTRGSGIRIQCDVASGRAGCYMGAKLDVVGLPSRRPDIAPREHQRSVRPEHRVTVAAVRRRAGVGLASAVVRGAVRVVAAVAVGATVVADGSDARVLAAAAAAGRHESDEEGGDAQGEDEAEVDLLVLLPCLTHSQTPFSSRRPSRLRFLFVRGHSERSEKPLYRERDLSLRSG